MNCLLFIQTLSSPSYQFLPLMVKVTPVMKMTASLKGNLMSFVKFCVPNFDHDLFRFGRCFNITRPLSNYKIFYIGSEGPTLTNFMLTYHDNLVRTTLLIIYFFHYFFSFFKFYSYNPSTCTSRTESINVNQMLRKRYYLIQKAKEANTVGILVGTLGAGTCIYIYIYIYTHVYIYYTKFFSKLKLKFKKLKI